MLKNRNYISLDDSTRDKILDIAARLFAERGYAGTSLEQVIKQCRIGKDTFYRRFDSKLALFEAMAVREREVVELRFQEFIESNAGNTLDRLESSLRWLLDVNLEPQLISYKRIAFTEASIIGKAAQEASSAITDHLVELMEELISKNSIRENNPHEVVMYVINTLVLAPMMMTMLGNEQPLTPEWRQDYFDRTWLRIFQGISFTPSIG